MLSNDFLHSILRIAFSINKHNIMYKGCIVKRKIENIICQIFKKVRKTSSNAFVYLHTYACVCYNSGLANHTKSRHSL